MSEKVQNNIVSFEEFNARRRQKAAGSAGSLRNRFDDLTTQPILSQTSDSDAVRNTPMSDADYALEKEFNDMVISLLPSSTLKEQGQLQVRLRELAKKEWERWQALPPDDRALAMKAFSKARLDEMQNTIFDQTR